MTKPTEKKSPLDQQIRLLEQTAYLHYPQSPRVDESPAPNAGTTSVNPSAPHPMNEAPFEGTTTSRGNPHGPTPFMLPRVPGANAPSTPQETGSNMPGSTIPQASPVTQQVPGMVFSQDADPLPGDHELPDALVQQLKTLIEEPAQPKTKR